MAITLQVVSPLDQSTVLFDLNDPTGVNSALYGSVTTGLVPDVDLGTPTLDSTQVDAAGIDTTFTTFSRRATATMTFRLRIKALSYDNLTLAVGKLAQYLSQGCVLKWIPTGSAYTQYIDVLPSSTPALLNGRELALYETMALFDTPQGVPFSVTRQAYVRGSKLDPATNKMVTNATALRDSNQDGLPDGWTKLTTPTVSIVTATESCHVVAASAGHGVYQNTVTASAASGQTWTVSCDLQVTSGSVDLNLNWRTGADATISQSVTTTAGPASWRRVTVTGTAPGTTDHIRVRIEANGGAATYDFRNVQAEQAAAATPFRVCQETVALDPATTGMAKMLPVYNPGSAWAPLEITTAFPDASTTVQRLSYALVSSSAVPGDDYLADYLNGPFYGQAEANGNGWTLTAGSDTTLAGAADANASPGSGTTVARISRTGNVATSIMAIRWSRSTLLDCLRGTFGVYIRCKPTASANSSHELTIKWGTGGAVQYSNDTYTLDNSASSAAAYRLLYLGNIVLPAEPTAPTISSLQIELWQAMSVGFTAANLDVDYLMLSPTEDVAVTELSGGTSDFSQAASGTTAIFGVPYQLGAPVSDGAWTAGSASGGAITETAALNACAWGGNGKTTIQGLFTGVGGGRHTFALDSYRGPQGSGTTTHRFEIVHFDSGTAANPVVDAFATLSYTGAQTGYPTWTPSLNVTDVSGKLYQVRVTTTAVGTGTYGLVVRSLTHTQPPQISQNQQVRTDPGSIPQRYAAEKLDSSGNLLVSMNATKVPFWIPPGLSLLQMETWDVQTDSNDDELAHINARTLTVKPAVYPRSWV